MKMKRIMEQGEYIPAGEDVDMDTLEERLNQALRRFGKPERLWADVNEGTGEIEVYILAEDMMPISMVNNIARFVRDTTEAELVGITGGANFAFYLNFKR